MKNTNRNLDDLFAAARKEDPIISSETARELLRTSEHMQSASFIFSTKGIIMTTLGLSLASLTAYILLSGSPQKNFPNKFSTPQPQVRIENLFAHSIEEPMKREAKATKKVSVEKTENGEIPVQPIPATLPSVTTPVKVAGITPMILPSEKFEVMGVSKKDDGTIIFSQKNENGKIFSMAFPKNTWGIIVGGKDLENAASNAPRFAPMMVTDTKGNKRLMQFSSEKDGKKMRALEIASRSDDENIDPQKIDEAIHNALEIAGNLEIGKDGDVDLLKVGSDSVQNKHLKIFVKTDRREMDSNGKNEKIVIFKNLAFLDSTLKGQGKITEEKKFKQFLTDLHIDPANSKAKIKINISNNEAELDNDPSDVDIQDIEANISQHLMEAEKKSLDLNTLIPILVRPATSEHFDKHEGIIYNDGLIFWYDNSEAFVKAAKTIPIITEYDIDWIIKKQNADSIVINDKNGKKVIRKADLSVGKPDHGTNQIISSSIYPNPARNSAKILFSLSEPHTIGFSVHDLLGKRIMEAGSVAEIASGNYEKDLDLSSLPAGVYLLVLTTDKGEQTTQRLVIEK
jgi:hypothetical protein